MSAYNLPRNSGFVKASDIDSSDGRECRFCGKKYDDDGRARAAYLRHLAECRPDDHQTTLTEWSE